MLLGAGVLIACGPSKSEAEQSSAAGGEGTPQAAAEPRAQCVGMPRELPKWHGHLRKLAAAGKLAELVAVPTGEANTWKLCLTEGADAQAFEDSLELALMDSDAPENASPIFVGQSKARLDFGASGGGWLPAGAQLIAFGDPAATGSDPIMVIASAEVLGEAPADAVRPSPLCLPASTPFDADGGGESTKAAGRKYSQQTFDRAVVLPYGDDRIWIAIDDAAQTAELVRVRIDPEGCSPSSDGAAMALQGVLEDVRVEGEEIVLRHRDALTADAEVSETRWTPEPGVIATRQRPAPPDAKALLAALSRSKAPLTGKLSCMSLAQLDADKEVTLAQRIAELSRASEARTVTCLAHAEGEPRRCTAEFGSLRSSKQDSLLEVEFEVSDEDVKPLSCLSL